MEDEGVCVCCGAHAGPLFRQYSPTVLKLTKCKRCGSIADKYLEYDPVIIMVDLILLSKEACRHVLYNTPFKAYWKLFVLLIIMETYVDWSNDNFYKKLADEVSNSNKTANIVDPHSYLRISNDNFKMNSLSPLPLNGKQKKDKFSDSDNPFSFEESLYITFACSLIAMAVFIIVAFIFSLFFGLTSLLKDKVEFLLVCKGFTLASAGSFLLLPALIWGSDHDRSFPQILVFGYTFLSLINVHSVIYQCNKANSFIVLLIAHVIKMSISSNLKMIGQLAI